MSLREAHDRLAHMNAGADRNWAMPVVLNIPKSNPPLHSELLAAAAQAVLRVCLSPDPDFGPSLAEWYGARIRKVARRARNAAWERVQRLPGATARVGTAEARALLPCAIVDTPPEVNKLQIGGTDLEHDAPGPAEGPVIYLDRGLKMSTGKAAAQVGHAAMLLAAQLSYEEVAAWAPDFRLSVREVPREEFWRLDGVAVVDAGFTEVAPGSVTAVGIYTG